MSILIYNRIWNKAFFTDVVKKAFPDSSILYYSDFKSKGDFWTGDYIYKSKISNYVKPEEAEEIVRRCRFLRSLDYDKSVLLVNNLYAGLDKIFSENSIEAVIMPMIDCYSLDVLDRVARKHGVVVIAFVQNFIKGYSRFSVRGERIDLDRDVSENEVSEVEKMLLNKEYKPTFSMNRKINKKDLFKRCIYNFIKDKIYFSSKKIIEHDKYNYHYNTPNFSEYFQILRTIKQTNFLKISDLSCIEKKNSVYLPLHFTPEATVDYWCKDFSDAKYEERIIDLVKNNPDVLFIIKEHPAMYGRRIKEFYAEITKLDNVKLIEPYEDSNKLLELVDNVVVHTGSVGVEALIRGKRVICLTENYYSDIHPNAILTSKFSKDLLDREIVEYSNKDFLASLLKGLFKYKYAAGWHVYEESDNIDVLADWCKHYYNNAK